MKPLVVLSFLILATVAQAQKGGPAELSSPRSAIKPLMDVPLRDAAITRSPDGEWLMVGTQPTHGDFQNNDGIFLWRSKDFHSWTGPQQVWSIERAPDSWQKAKRVNPENPAGPLVRGMVSPEIHAAKGTFWITYSMNHRGTGLLKSTSGKPDGPYEDVGRITEDGTDASLFVDEDGSVYWVVGQGWIGKMNEDLTALAEPLKLALPASFPALKHGSVTMSDTHAPRMIGQAGAHLFKAEGRYWLAVAGVRDRMGVGCWDTFVSGADSLDGPWDAPMLMIPHGGQTTVFKGPNDELSATFAPRDVRAAFRDRAAVVPLIFSDAVQYGTVKVKPFPRRKFGILTEFGPWAQMEPAAKVSIRDLQFMAAPDGYTYLTGSGVDASYAGKIMLFRSKDLKTWEPVDVQFDFLSIPGVTEEDRAARFDDPKQQRSLGAKYMDSEIYFAGDTFHLFTSLYGGPKKNDGSAAFSGPLWLRSTTGKPEGPYEYVDRASAQMSAFQDSDGKWYLFFNGNLEEWDPKAPKRSGVVKRLQTDIGTLFSKGDVATNLAKIHDKYVIFATGWCGGTYGENYRVDGTYDWVYWQSDTLEGPYSMPRKAFPMPHAGHSSQPIKQPDGSWAGLLFGNDSTGPWWCMPGVLFYESRLDPDGTVRFEILDKTP